MKLFGIFKNTDPKPLKRNPKEELRYLIDYIPDFYKNQRQYKNAIEFLDHHEFSLVLESLIELADETGHYFSEEFWERIAASAKAMNLVELAVYSLNQIERNQQELKWKTPFGWTTVKIDETHFQHYISEKIKERQVAERHKKDNAYDLLKKDGIYLKMHGRAGTLYIVDHRRLAEVELELGMHGLILYFINTMHWLLPLKQPLTAEEKQNIRSAINSWALRTKNAVEFED